MSFLPFELHETETPPAIPSPGRQPTFTDGYSTTRVRLRLNQRQWQEIEQEAARQGKSFREFLKQRLVNSLKEFVEVDYGPIKTPAK